MWKKKLEFRGETRDDRTCVYTLSGNLFGSVEGYAFQDEVREKIASGAAGNVVVDLRAVDRIDSSGVGILVATMWSASQAGVELILASLNPRIEKVLSIAMLLDHVNHAGSVSEALELLGRKET